jgi:superfamily I DNA/RNA helicase
LLDSDQARVVAHDDGPAAVLAGAGSGKTRCTTERAVRRLTESGLPPQSVLLLTFTNKAAAEMRERIAARLPQGVATPWIGTFHSFGNQLLRRHGKAIGVPRNATLMDAEDAGRMLDALLAGPFPDRSRRLDAVRLHEAVTAQGCDATDEADLESIHARCDEAGFGPVASARLLERLRRYDREKRRSGVLDFADLIALPARLLRTRPELRERIAGQLRDVTVDEAQDTDGAQFRLLRLIAPQSKTVLLVGDDDQAIYEWRHARPENLRDFIDAFGATVYRLERNYRSTPAIVGSGATLVRHNAGRLEKSPYAVRQGTAADVVRLMSWDDAEAMAEGVADAIAASIAGGASAADVAVLYRKNRLARTLETALLRRGIPYRIKAGTDLLGHADVRMMLAAGRLAANGRDVRALSRLADLVPGLGARGVGRLVEADQPLQAGDRLSPQATRGLARLAEAVADLAQRGPAELLGWCDSAPVFRDWLQQRARRRLKSAGQAITSADIRQALRPALGRMGAVQRAMQRRLQSLPADAAVDLRWATALEIVAAGTDEAETDQPKVTLGTVHGAKGLEWPEVHLYGFSEGLMPMARDGVVDNLTEERRLAYVAITRAQNRLTLHHADRVDIGTGRGIETVALSRFVDELDAGGSVQRLDRRGGAVPAAEAVGDERPQDWLAQMRRSLS